MHKFKLHIRTDLHWSDLFQVLGSYLDLLNQISRTGAEDSMRNEHFDLQM